MVDAIDKHNFTRTNKRDSLSVLLIYESAASRSKGYHHVELASKLKVLSFY